MNDYKKEYDIELSDGSIYKWIETSVGERTLAGCIKCRKCKYNKNWCERTTKECEMVYVEGNTLTKDEVRKIIESK